MQATIREHRDNGQAGGYFTRYNIIRVSLYQNGKPNSNLKYLFVIKTGAKGTKSKAVGALCSSTARDRRGEFPAVQRAYALPR